MIIIVLHAQLEVKPAGLTGKSLCVLNTRANNSNEDYLFFFLKFSFTTFLKMKRTHINFNVFQQNLNTWLFLNPSCQSRPDVVRPVFNDNLILGKFIYCLQVTGGQVLLDTTKTAPTITSTIRAEEIKLK